MAATTRHGFRKGDFVQASMAGGTDHGWVSGDTERQVSVSDLNWKRLGQFTATKVTIIQLSTGLLALRQRQLAFSSPPVPLGQVGSPTEVLMKLKILVTTAVVTAISLGARAEAANPDHIQELLKTKQCPICDLSGATLNSSSLQKANLTDANLSAADLRGANLREADLRGADLRGANLSKANLTAAIMSGANLSGAYLRGADLTNAELANSNFCGAIMPEGKLSTQGCK